MAEPDADVQKWIDGLSGKIRRKLSSVIRQEAEGLSEAQRIELQSLQRPPEETGSLEGSCRVEEGSNDLEFIVLAGGEQTTKDGYDHALAFEFGTSKQQANPFFFSTYAERRDDMQSRILSATEDAIDS